MQDLAVKRTLALVAMEKPDLSMPPLRSLQSARRALLIINSKSGPNGDSLSRIREIVERLEAFGFRIDVRVKLHKKAARQQARLAARARYDVVIAAGGDGTVEAVAGGLVGARRRTALGILPLGTYNNVATSLGIPSDLAEACALIGIGVPHAIDVGRLQAATMKKPRIFLEMATVGVGAALAPLGQHLEKGRWGEAARVAPLVVGMTAVEVEIVVDNAPRAIAPTLLVTISNAPWAAAAVLVAAAARMDDGLLNVSVYPEQDQVGLAARFLSARMSNSDAASPNQIVGRVIDLRAARPLPVSADSRLVGMTPVRVEVLARALRVIPGHGFGLARPAADSLIVATREVAQTMGISDEGAAVVMVGERTHTANRAGLGRLPVAVRTMEALGKARGLLVPLVSAAAGAAAISLLRSIDRRGR